METGTTVLIVDDENSIRLTLCEFLQVAGHTVLTAADAAEALRILKGESVDVVVSDIVLPRINGVDLLRTIREKDQRVQVIMMTGEPTVETASAAVRNGAFDYLFKPITKDAILKAVANAAKVKRLSDEAERLTVENERHRNHLKELVAARTRALEEEEAERRRIEEQSHKLEEQLRQSQKMEAIGQLAGGVAHDFNNLLMAISGSTEYAQDSLPADSEVQPALEEVLAATKRAAALTRQLLAFSRRQILKPEVLDLNAAMGDLLKLLGRLIGEDIELRFVPGSSVSHVRVDAGQLEQVIINLAVNARDAMLPTGGTLTIRTQNTTITTPNEALFAATGEAPQGDFVMLTISDTGSGMSAAVRRRIFEPFFTTKAANKGTGLGLATVYGIIRQHDGYIGVESREGEGSTFRVYLPQVAAVAECGAAAAESAAAPKGTETLLVVEDDMAVRHVESRSLQALGYTVRECGTAAEARDLAAACGDEIDMVISDVILPDQSGRELVESLAVKHPHLTLILTSGYVGDRLAAHDLSRANIPFLPKPFSQVQLAKLVREVLDGRESGAT